MGPSVIYMVIGVTAFIVIILFTVFRGNDSKRGSGAPPREAEEQVQEEAAEEAVIETEEAAAPKLRAEDLDLGQLPQVDMVGITAGASTEKT